MTKLRVAGAAIGLFAVGALAGRMSVPAHVVPAEKLKEVEAKAKIAVAAAFDDAKAAKAGARKLDVDKSFLQDYHWTWHPDGTVEATASTTKKDTRSVASASTASAEHKAASSSAKANVEYRYLEKVTEAYRPKWSIEARAGLGLDGKLRYQGEVGRRLFSGVWLTLGADVTSRVALAGVRVEF